MGGGFWEGEGRGKEGDGGMEDGRVLVRVCRMHVLTPRDGNSDGKWKSAGKEEEKKEGRQVRKVRGCASAASLANANSSR